MNIKNLFLNASNKIKKFITKINDKFPQSLKTPVGASQNIPPMHHFKKIRVLYFVITILVILIGIIIFYLIEPKEIGARIKSIQIPQFFYGKVAYTKNPASSHLPSQSVIKIIINKDADNETTGSGLLISDDGLIITNAHVVATELGKGQKEITICISNEDGRKLTCEQKAEVIDVNMEKDLAIIKSLKPIKEIKSYKVIVEEKIEPINEIIPYGETITAVGFPGVGGSSITITKGVVSGYQDAEEVNYNCSFISVPKYLKTDTEINFGNSGGAVFDTKNRYIGISSLINQDDGGKIAYITYWSVINDYLSSLIINQKIKLPSKQWIALKLSEPDHDWHDGNTAILREDYDLAIDRLKKYTQSFSENRKGWCSLCTAYSLAENKTEELGNCAEELRALDEDSTAISWLFTSTYQQNNEKYNDALDSINKGLNIQPDSVLLNIQRAKLEYQLRRYSDMHTTNRKIIRLDETNNLAWYLEGIYEIENNNDLETGILYIKYSYLLNPTSYAAEFLADQYMESETLEDQYISLKYRVSSLILDPEDIGAVLLMAYNTQQLYRLSSGSWGEDMAAMSDVLNDLGLTLEIVEPIANADETMIKERLAKAGNVELAKDEKLAKGFKYLFDMSISWLYAFMGEKNKCLTNYYISYDELDKLLIATGMDDQQERAELIGWNTIMMCLCENTDYSDEVIQQCNTQKSSDLCGPNMVFLTTSGCISLTKYCKELYGPNASAVNNECICNAGYTFSETTGKCVAVCGAGYTYNASSGKCASICSYREYYSNGNCYCNATHPILLNGSCYTYTEHCQRDFGVLSYGISDGKGGTSCYCKAGYKWYYDFNTPSNFCVSIY